MKPKSTLRHFLALAGSSLLAISSASAQTDGNWNIDSAGDWSTATNWTSDPNVPDGAGSIIGLNNDITANRTVTIDETSRTVGTLNIGDSDNTHFFTLSASGGAGLIFNNNGSGATLTSTTTLATLTIARDTISAPVTLADNLTVSVAGTMSGTSSTGYLAISGDIGESGGVRSITKSGNGTLVLTGNNTYSGGFILNEGTVQVTTSSNQVVNPYTGFGTGTLTINGGTIGTRSAGSFTTANDSVWNANFALFRGQTGIATWNHQGHVTLGADITPTLPNNGFVLNISGNVSETGGARSLTVSNGNLTMSLSGNNTYSGGTTLSSGRLNINSATALGSGTFAMTGGTIDNTSDSAVTLSNASTLPGAFTFGGTNDLTLSNANGSFLNNNAVTLNGTNSTLIVDGVFTNNTNNNSNWNVNGAENTLVIGGLALSSNSVARTVTIQGTGNLTITGAVTNGLLATSGNLTKAGTGTLTLSGASTYTGTTTVSGGILTITGATHDTSAITLTGGSLGLDTGLPVTAANATVDLTTGTISVTGSTGAASYTLLTAASIIGTPVLADPVPGYALQLSQDDTELRLVNTGGASPYYTWSGGAAFDADANGDGVSNGLAFLLGATGPNVSALDKLPTITETGGNLVLTFDMLKPGNRGGATLSIEHSSDLGITDTWTTVAVPDADDGPTSGVTFVVGTGVGTTNPVTATISASEASATGKLFGRLKAVNP